MMYQSEDIIHDMPRQDKISSQDKAMTRHDKTRRKDDYFISITRQDKIRQNKIKTIGQDKTSQNQVTPNQAKPSQAKSSQVKPSQAKPNQMMTR
jgi:hypothetical protein